MRTGWRCSTATHCSPRHGPQSSIWRRQRPSPPLLRTRPQGATAATGARRIRPASDVASERADGLRIFAGPVGDTSIVASHGRQRRPRPSTSGPRSTVPGGWAVSDLADAGVWLGRMTASLERPSRRARSSWSWAGPSRARGASAPQAPRCSPGTGRSWREPARFGSFPDERSHHAPRRAARRRAPAGRSRPCPRGARRSMRLAFETPHDRGLSCRRSARDGPSIRPSGPTAEDVHVQVVDLLPAMLAAVHDQSIPVVADPLVTCDLRRDAKDTPHDRLVLLADVVGRGDRLLRADEHVGRRSRVDVPNAKTSSSS